jgi:hypothetical protein
MKSDRGENRRRYGHCKACHYQLTNDWRRKNKPVVDERTPAYNLARRLRIPVAEARQLIATMPDRCEVCGVKGTWGGNAGLGFDHDHLTGQIRGVLCNTCNGALGMVNDDPARLRALARYLERARGHRIPRGTKEESA